MTYLIRGLGFQKRMRNYLYKGNSARIYMLFEFYRTAINPNQFEIIWQASGNTRASAPKEVLEIMGYTNHKEDRGGCGVVNGKRQYSRIIIRNKHL